VSVVILGFSWRRKAIGAGASELEVATAVAGSYNLRIEVVPNEDEEV
jgi:hypothetical protein